MEPLDFLAAVLPSPGYGYYCAAELSSPRKTHVFVENLNEMQPRVEAWLQDKRDVYFALATFEEKGKRTADNAEYLRSLFIDMDGYYRDFSHLPMEERRWPAERSRRNWRAGSRPWG